MKATIVRVWFVQLAMLACVSVSAAQNGAEGVSEAQACRGDAVVNDASFSMRTISFATDLAVLGPRPAAGDGEARARAAVIAELEAIGLDVVTEAFEYETFSITKTTLVLGGAQVVPVILGLDPFAGELRFAGEAVVIIDPAQATDSLRGRIVVTNHPIMQLMIAEFEPSVVICAASEDFENFVNGGSREVELEVEGVPKVLRSENVVARFGPRKPATREILVTSHLDAYQESPGANDNGTGLGLMIELARAFRGDENESDAPIVFVAFGAEENGAIGSRAFMQEHINGLPDIVAVVNLDTLGGARGPVIASKPTAQGEGPEGVRNRIPGSLRNRAWEGPDGQWRMIHPEIVAAAFTSYYPMWLHEVVMASAVDVGVEVVHLDLISDHRTFALAGVPAISLQSKEHRIHSENDTADALVEKTIHANARLAARILCRLKSLQNPQAVQPGS